MVRRFRRVLIFVITAFLLGGIRTSSVESQVTDSVEGSVAAASPAGRIEVDCGGTTERVVVPRDLPVFFRGTPFPPRSLEQGNRVRVLGARDAGGSLLAERIEIVEDRALDFSSYDQSREDFRRAVIAEMNKVRAAKGLPSLREELRLDRAAADRARDMEQNRYFEHVSPKGVDPFTWVDRRGYRYVSAGENLATGFQSAAEVVAGWMNSPSHRENVLDPEFRDVGIAVADGSPVSDYDGPTVVALYGKESPRS